MFTDVHIKLQGALETLCWDACAENVKNYMEDNI